MSDQPPLIDLTRIAFPTDRLTVKELRERNPLDFDRLDKKDGSPKSTEENFHTVLDCEREVAWRAFRAALGQPVRISPIAEETRPIVMREYVRLGLATGPHHAEQLIRNVEAQAAAQAKGYGPPPRS
jgi:hypothetical protein